MPGEEPGGPVPVGPRSGVRAAIHHRSVPGDGIVLHLPAYHPLLVDLTPFSMENTEVFVPGAEPHGVIEATVRRDEMG